MEELGSWTEIYILTWRVIDFSGLRCCFRNFNWLVVNQREPVVKKMICCLFFGMKIVCTKRQKLTKITKNLNF